MATVVAMKSYTIQYGGKELELNVPARNVRAEIQMTDFPPVTDLPGAIIDALEHPIGCTQLSEQVKAGDKVAIMTGDRITDKMLGVRDGIGFVLLDHLNGLGIPDKDITLVYAGGMHGNTLVIDHLGDELMGRVRTIVHDAADDSHLTFCGVTPRGTPVWINTVVAKADFSLGIGEISPTVHGGWCGGGKIMLPGVAGQLSIEQNHAMVLWPNTSFLLLEGNQMRMDMEDAADLAGLKMKLDVLVNSKAEVVDVYAGDFRQEHRTAMPKAREIWTTRMDPTDIAIVYPGEGRERALGSSLFASLEAGQYATIDSGIVIMVLSAVEGWSAAGPTGQHASAPEGMHLSLEELARMLVRRDEDVRGVSIMYLAKKALASRRMFLVSEGISEDDALAYGFAFSTRSYEEALGKAFDELGQNATISTNIQHGIGWRMAPWVEG
ncbi:MAG: lactate racemase domain-containing protein [Dehalococcoidia bacterium]|jgi:nickel-dependent lactate racemase|nr:lactate racemase domain-containing protein [Dehalococcoidia bacterium]